MNDVNNVCWDWHSAGIRIGDPYNTGGDIRKLDEALKDYLDTDDDPKSLIDQHCDWRIYKIINHEVVDVLTIQEAIRLLKISQL